MSDESGEGEGEVPGFLTLLDDKLDALEAAGRLSRPQWREQYVGGGFEDGSPVQALAPGCGQRQPLKQAVKDLTIQWSEAILALAYEGNAACCSLLAQMSFRPGGYGAIPGNKSAALQWLWKAIEAGDFESKQWARKVFREEYLQHLVRKEHGEGIFDASKSSELAAAIEQWRITDDQAAVEEKRLEEARQKEEGE